MTDVREWEQCNGYMKHTPAEGAIVLKFEIKGGVEIEIIPDEIKDQALFEAIVVDGLKANLAKGAVTKLSAGITKKPENEQAQLKAQIKLAAEETIAGLYEGKMPGRKSSGKRSGAVQNEAMRLAKALVKDLLRKEGYKVGAFTASEHTAFAKTVLEGNQELYKKAEENLAQRAAMPVKGLNVGTILGERTSDESLKAKPKIPPKPKAGAKDVISAAQAGKVAPRAKPQHSTAH